MANHAIRWKERNRATPFFGVVTRLGLFLLALMGTVVLGLGNSRGDEAAGLQRAPERELLEAIRGSSATWQKGLVRVAYKINAADKRRAGDLRRYANEVLSETLDVVGIAVREDERDADIKITVADFNATSVRPTPEDGCSFSLVRHGRQLTQASATIVLGFASRECVRALALNIAGLSGPFLLNVPGTALSRTLTSDELTDVDRFLLKLAYAPASQVSQLISEHDALSRFMVRVHDVERAKLWSAQLQLALDAGTIDERKRNTYAALKVLGLEEADSYRLGTTMAWLSVMHAQNGKVSDAIETTSAALELLKTDPLSVDGTDVLGLEVNLRKLQAFSNDSAACAGGTALPVSSPSLGHIVSATAHYVDAVCGYQMGQLIAAADSIEKTLEECAVAYFGRCPNWEAFYVASQIHAARGKTREAVSMLELARGLLLEMVPAVDRCADTQLVRLKIAKLTRSLGDAQAARDVSNEAMTDEACRFSIPSDALSEFSEILQQQ